MTASPPSEVPRRYEVDPAVVSSGDEAIRRAGDAVAAGGLIILPTETVYGIACRPDDPSATRRLFEAKRRPAELNLPVLAATPNDAWSVGEPTRPARALADAFWPGPLTLVVPRTAAAARWELGHESGTVALRVPDHAICAALLELTGPLAATSANVSGRPPLSTAEQLVETFGDAVTVYLLLSADAPPPGGAASTVLDVSGDRIRMLRAGPIDRTSVDAVLAAAGVSRVSG